MAQDAQTLALRCQNGQRLRLGLEGLLPRELEEPEARRKPLSPLGGIGGQGLEGAIARGGILGAELSCYVAPCLIACHRACPDFDFPPVLLQDGEQTEMR